MPMFWHDRFWMNVTGKPLENPEIHHKDRVADKPRRALDETNLAAVNNDTYEILHKLDIETEKELEAFKANKTE